MLRSLFQSAPALGVQNQKEIVIRVETTPKASCQQSKLGMYKHTRICQTSLLRLSATGVCFFLECFKDGVFLFKIRSRTRQRFRLQEAKKGMDSLRGVQYKFLVIQNN